MMHRLLHWFYCLDLPDAAMLLAGGTVIFYLLKAALSHRRWWRWLLMGLLMLLLGAVVYSTLGNRTAGSTGQHIWIPFHSYREAAANGNREIYRSNLMNVALFYPAGLLLSSLLPVRWPGWLRCAVTVVLFAAVSAGVEYAQLRFVLGQCEIDDVIHNAAGALLGAAADNLLRPMAAGWKIE